MLVALSVSRSSSSRSSSGIVCGHLLLLLLDASMQLCDHLLDGAHEVSGHRQRLAHLHPRVPIEDGAALHELLAANVLAEVAQQQHQRRLQANHRQAVATPHRLRNHGRVVDHPAFIVAEEHPVQAEEVVRGEEVAGGEGDLRRRRRRRRRFASLLSSSLSLAAAADFPPFVAQIIGDQLLQVAVQQLRQADALLVEQAAATKRRQVGQVEQFNQASSSDHVRHSQGVGQLGGQLGEKVALVKAIVI
ncbi:hypothetical protein TYRP_005314 [Tyrophagus putrescentiae]|nr:hypothetical protein TYRP_005314 [Tyrophagus putrescentiae]